MHERTNICIGKQINTYSGNEPIGYFSQMQNYKVVHEWFLYVKEACVQVYIAYTGDQLST